MANPDEIEGGDKSYSKISFDDKASIAEAIRNKHSFQLNAIGSRQSIAVKWLRSEIEKQGMTSLTYNNNRWFVAPPLALIPSVGPWLAGAAAAKFTAENIRSPDYEIRRGLLTDFIEVTYRSKAKRSAGGHAARVSLA